MFKNSELPTTKNITYAFECKLSGAYPFRAQKSLPLIKKINGKYFLTSIAYYMDNDYEKIIRHSKLIYWDNEKQKTVAHHIPLEIIKKVDFPINMYNGGSDNEPTEEDWNKYHNRMIKYYSISDAVFFALQQGCMKSHLAKAYLEALHNILSDDIFDFYFTVLSEEYSELVSCINK